ncbi:MAG TPA: hypothetical protein VFC07_12520, partial [Verrucomicrobiae bacterium]|nr:hypothetical protein [Verrucomicrobiae bacterium]
NLFTALEVKAFTMQAVPSTGNAAEDQALLDAGFELIDFGRDRPRVEILFTPGAGQGQFRPLRISSDREIPVETSWSGQFKLDVITLPDIRVHRQFVTAVRFVMHTQLYLLNGNYLDRHRIQVDVKDSGTTPAMESDKGDFQTTLLTDIDFSIQDEAWPEIAETAPATFEPLQDTQGNAFTDTKGEEILGYTPP